MRKLDLKMFSQIVASFKGETGSVLLLKVMARATFGAGRQAIAILDKYFEHEEKKLAQAAAAKPARQPRAPAVRSSTGGKQDKKA